MRKFLGIVAGIVVAIVSITIVEMIGHQIFPPPVGLAMNDPAAVTTYITQAPTGAMLFIVAAWFCGALFGGWTAVTIGRWPTATWIIGALIAAGGIYNATQIPAPMWMQLSTALAPALGALAALHLPRARRIA